MQGGHNNTVMQIHTFGGRWEDAAAVNVISTSCLLGSPSHINVHISDHSGRMPPVFTTSNLQQQRQSTTTYLQFNVHFPREPVLAGSYAVFFLHLFPNKTFRKNWHNNNNNNNNNNDNVYGAVLMTIVIARVHSVYLMNADWAPGGRQPSDQANRLGLGVRR